MGGSGVASICCVEAGIVCTQRRFVQYLKSLPFKLELRAMKVMVEEFPFTAVKSVVWCEYFGFRLWIFNVTYCSNKMLHPFIQNWTRPGVDSCDRLVFSSTSLFRWLFLLFKLDTQNRTRHNSILEAEHCFRVLNLMECAERYICSRGNYTLPLSIPLPKFCVGITK